MFRRDGAVVFMRWLAPIVDNSRGVVYLIDGSSLHETWATSSPAEKGPLLGDGWYVYAENTNAWLRRSTRVREAFFTEPNVGWIEEEFNRNREYYEIVKNFLMGQNFWSATIERRYLGNGEIKVGDGIGRVPVDNDRVLDALNHVFWRANVTVLKIGDAVTFSRWCDLRALSYAIAYSAYDDILERLMWVHYPILTEQSSEAGWYFLVEDFLKWYERNLGQDVDGRIWNPPLRLYSSRCVTPCGLFPCVGGR